MAWALGTAALAAMVGAWWLALAALLAGAARLAGWSGARTLALAGTIWLAALAAVMLAPDSAGARFVGWTPAALVALGAVVTLAGAGAMLLGRLHRIAERRNPAAPGLVSHTPRAPTAAAAAPAFDPAAPLSDTELDRYARHIVLRELGGAGQRKLKAAQVLIVGAGGLGSPVALYLAAAGVGRITLADDDRVSLSNLQRQIMFRTADTGRPKVEAGADTLRALNPGIEITPLPRRITAGDAELIRAHDLVIDGTDSFAMRSAVNAACSAAGVPLLAGAIAQWEGQVTLYDPARGAPCLACLFPQPPAPGLAPACAEAGVVGALPGVIGAILALEAVKELGGVVESGAGAGLRGQMLLFDGLWGETRRVAVRRREGCCVCGAVTARAGAGP